MSKLRSALARPWLSLFPWLAGLALGGGLGLACTGDSGGNCSPGTTNCACAANNVCLQGLQCVAGYCVALGGDGDGDGDGETTGDGDGDNPCDGGQAFCGGKCVDSQTNILHCGGCNIACDATYELCYEGSCATDCSEAECEGFTYCDFDTSLCLPGCEYDEQCGFNEQCDYDTHTCECYPDYVMCAGECIWEGDPCEDNCGNGSIDNGEVCDGAALGGYDCTDYGYTGGALGCLLDCSDHDLSNCSNTDCGNGVVEVGEDCDGVNLNGEDCTDQGFLGGTLACSANCTFNTAGCNNNADSGDCCYDNNTPGCEVPAIQMCVCAQDAYCCNTEWDSACATQAVDDCGANCP